jgi:hypothetical protein
MRNRTSARTAELLLLLALLTAMLAAGCGHKAWPRAQAAQDAFAWKDVEAARAADCVTVSGMLQGGYANLDAITVQIEEMDEEPCLACPFSPQRSLLLNPADPNLMIRGPQATVLACGLDPLRTYRVRLEARNVFFTLGTALSEVLVLPPTE